MRNQNTKKLVLAAVLIALGVAASPLYIPIGASKCFPVQHLVNVLAAVLLGPWYGVSMAFVTSLLRVLIGTGSLLAFPGSMCGALLAGLLYKYGGCNRRYARLSGSPVFTRQCGRGPVRLCSPVRGEYARRHNHRRRRIGRL